jgi:hypothetical protein
MIRAGLFADPDEALLHLAAAKSHKTDSDDAHDMRALIAAGVAVRLVDADGETVGGYVVQPFNRVLWITAAAGRADVPLCPIIDAHATEQARQGGYVALGFQTERRGLVDRTTSLGYFLTSKIGRTFYMRKNLK